MKTKFFAIGLLGSIAALLASCSSVNNTAQLEARNNLEQRNISFTVATFIQTAKNGNNAVLKNFLEAGMDINAKQSDTALTGAIGTEKTNTVIFLLENGANVNEPSDWESPLGIASYKGYFNIANILIKYGANVNGLAPDGMTPLMNAVYTNKTKIVQLLLENGASSNYILPDTSEAPIILAARNGNIEIVKLLLEYKCNPNNKDSGGLTALDWAIINGNTDAAEELINSPKIQLITKESESSKPMLLALQNNNFKIADALIKKGISPNSPAYDKMPLIVWCAKNNNVAAVKFLVEHKANSGLRDSLGQDALDYAEQNNNAQIIEILKKA